MARARVEGRGDGDRQRGATFVPSGFARGAHERADLLGSIMAVRSPPWCSFGYELTPSTASDAAPAPVVAECMRASGPSFLAVARGRRGSSSGDRCAHRRTIPATESTAGPSIGQQDTFWSRADDISEQGLSSGMVRGISGEATAEESGRCGARGGVRTRADGCQGDARG